MCNMRMTLVLNSGLYRFSLVYILLGELKTNGRKFQGDRLREIKQRAECQSNNSIELKKEEVSLRDSILIQSNGALDQIFFHICISLCSSEFIKEFSREMSTNNSIELFSAIIPNPPIFSRRISHCCPFQMEMRP